MIAARPRPAADFAQGLIVDLDEDDIAARFVPMEAVPTGAQHVFRNRAEFDRAEDQSGNRRPQQQLPRPRFSHDLLALRHVRAILPRGTHTHAREKVIKSLTAFRLTGLAHSTVFDRPATSPPRTSAGVAYGLHLHPVDFRSRLFRRLFRGVVGHAGAAHAADERDQRHFHGDRGRGADRGGGRGTPCIKWLGLAAVVLASVNIFGGFAVTQRMLSMYKKKSARMHEAAPTSAWGLLAYLVAGVYFILALRGCRARRAAAAAITSA